MTLWANYEANVAEAKALNLGMAKKLFKNAKQLVEYIIYDEMALTNSADEIAIRSISKDLWDTYQIGYSEKN